MHAPDTAEDVFGFGSVRSSTQERIKQIKPTAPPDPPPDFSRVDEIAGNAGFVSREAPKEPEGVYGSGRAQVSEPTIALNMHAPAGVGRAFQHWCKENRYSYPEGLAEIMRRAGLPTR